LIAFRARRANRTVAWRQIISNIKRLRLQFPIEWEMKSDPYD
jgi:hypothetical protein